MFVAVADGAVAAAEHVVQPHEGDGAEQHGKGAHVERELDRLVFDEMVADADEHKDQRRDRAPGLDLVLQPKGVGLRAPVQEQARGGPMDSEVPAINIFDQEQSELPD